MSGPTTSSKSHSTPRWGTGGNAEQGQWPSSSTHSLPVSERLRMLDEAMTPGPWTTARWGHGPTRLRRELGRYVTNPVPQAQNFPRVAALRNALPALVALVEAAEQARPQPEQIAPLRAALSALSTALPGVEVEA